MDSKYRQLILAAEQAAADGDDAAAHALLDEADKYAQSLPQPGAGNEYNAIDGMSGYEKFKAGMGKGAVDSITGITGIFGNHDPFSFGDRASSDDALTGTDAGKYGDLAGNIALSLPFMFIPGANTVKGSALVGGVLGAATRDGNIGERMESGAFGLAGGAVGGMIPYAGKVVQKTFAPFGGAASKRGVIAGLLANELGDNADTVASRLESYFPKVPGSQPTAAEAGESGLLSAMQRFAEQANPEEYAFRRMQNAGARRAAVNEIAGTDAQLSRAEDLRSAFAGPLYDAAKAATVPVDETLRDLLKRPSMAAALQQAQRLSAEAGSPISKDFAEAVLSGNLPAEISGEGLHWLKLGLDSMKKDPANPLSNEMLRRVMNTSDAFEAWRADAIPEYARAQSAYRSLSKPISKMQTGRAFADKVNSALSDHGPYVEETAETFARALRDLDGTAAKATGFKSAKAADILSPDDLQSLSNVAEELNRKAMADRLGRGVGSNTFQNFAMNGIAEAAGIPSTMAGLLRFIPGVGTTANALHGAAGHVYAGAEKQMREMLADAFLDPKKTAELIRMGLMDRNNHGLLYQAGRAFPALPIGTSTYLSQQ